MRQAEPYKRRIGDLQKNTGVFNDRGVIPQEQVDEMKVRLKENKGNIWHGFISLSEEESPKIDTPEKCVELIKRTFPSFLKDAKLRPDNIDLMCALHLDRPHHLHVHFVCAPIRGKVNPQIAMRQARDFKPVVNG